MSKKRILILYLGFVLALLAGTWALLGETGLSRTFVENLLAKVIRRDRFSLRDAAVDLGGGVVTLRGLQVATSEQQAGGARLAVEHVELGVETNPLGEPGRVREVRVRGLELEIDLAAGRFPDLAQLFDVPGALGDGPTGAPPPLEILDSRLRLSVSTDVPPIEFRDVKLTVLPIELGSSVVVLKGTMAGPNGEIFVVDGRADVAKPEVRVMLRLTDRGLDPESVMPYSRDAGDLLAEIDASGRIESFLVWLEYPDRTDPAAPQDQALAGVRIDLTGVACNVPAFPYPVRGARARLDADMRAGGTVRFEFVQDGPGATLKATGEIGGLLEDRLSGEVHVTARDVALDADLGRALARIDDARLVWEAFSPSVGRGDADIRVELRPGERAAEFGMDLTLRDTAVRFVGFEAADGTRVDGVPLPVRGIAGRVHVRRGEVVIHEITGRIDDGRLNVNGRIGTSPTDRELRLHVESDSLAMSPAIRDALAGFDPGLPTTWDEYAPQGSTSLTFDLRSRSPEGDQLRVVLRPLAASARWAGFPCRVEAIEGRIEIGDDAVDLDLRGKRGPADVAIRGRFLTGAREPAGDGPAAELALRTGPLAVDDELRAAMRVLSPSLGDAVDRYELGGSVRVQLATWRLADREAFDYDVRADLEDATATLALPVRGIAGPIFVQGSGETAHVELSSVRGEIAHAGDIPPSAVLAQGRLDTVAPAAGGSAAPRLDVTAVVRGLPLDDRLGSALDRIDALDLETWRVLAPSGRIDLVWHRASEGSADSDHQRLQIQLLDVGSDAAFLVAPARAVTGSLTIVDGVAGLAGVRGMMADAEFRVIEGTIAHERDATRFGFTVASDDFPVDERIANLLSGPLRTTYLDRRVHGRVAVNSLRIDMLVPDSGAGIETRLAGHLRALGIHASLGAELSDFTGRIAIDDTRISESGGVVHGNLSDSAVTLFGHRVDELGAKFVVDHEQVVFTGLLGKAYGGTVQGGGEPGGRDLAYRFDAPGRLSFALAWNGIDIARAMRASGTRDPRVRGELAGRFDLAQLDGAELADVIGEGELRISGGDLGAVPAFTAIYSYLAEPRRPRFDRLGAKFHVRDQRITVDSLEIGSPLMTATGKGTIDLAGWIDMRIDFPDFFGKSADWTFLPQVLRAVTSGLARFQIHGDLRSPQTRPLWIGREAANQAPLGPIPAARPVRR
ncbi:MAG: hypothetical protein HZB39_11420 [Planctomycetes bacterium]|nr:hypothetical protein [Planctomycetota bacterium]